MKNQELSDTTYNILCNGRKIYSSLTEEEYFDVMEDLSIQYYQTGSPHPEDLETEIVGKKWSLINNGKIKGRSE